MKLVHIARFPLHPLISLLIIPIDTPEMVVKILDITLDLVDQNVVFLTFITQDLDLFLRRLNRIEKPAILDIQLVFSLLLLSDEVP